MKALFCILSLAVIINLHSSYSQQAGWLPQTSGLTEDLYSIHFENSLTGWAAGANGKIIKTTNAGIVWSSQASGVNITLRSIFFTSSSTGWAVGDGGKIIKTTNGGSVWNNKSSGVTSNLNTLCFIDAQTGFAAGASGVIIKTTNGGDTWFSIPSSITSNINSINAASSSLIWAVGETGKILKTTNAGNTWIINVDLGSTCNLYSVHFPTAQTGYIAGSYTQSGQQFVFIYNTISAGDWWFYQYSGLSNILRSVYFVNAYKGVAVGDSGKIACTINGGLNWFTQYSFKTNNLYSINLAGEKNGWIAGSSGLILNTITTGFFDTLNTSRRDLGVIPLIKNASLLKNAKYRVIFRPDTVNLSFNIIRSLNNGVSFDTMFSNLSLPDTGKEIDGLIIKVDRIKSGPPYNNNSINTGVVKDPGTKPIDTIQTRLPGWDYFPVQNCFVEGSKYLLSPARPWQSKSMSLSYPTSGTYTNIGSGLKPVKLRKVKIVFTGYGSGQMAYRYSAASLTSYAYQDMKQVPFKVYEIDESDATPAPRQLNCAFLEFPQSEGGTPDGKWQPTADSLGGKDILYIFGSNYSSEPQLQYTAKNLLLTSSIDVMYVWSAKLKTASSVFHVNDELIIYPYTVTVPEIDPGYPLYYEFSTFSPIGIKNISTEVPKEFSLLQNYPNPFNPTTKIKASLGPSQGGKQDVKLTIYDVMGREIAVFTPPLGGGREGLLWEVEWNASNYSSGIYFSSLSINGNVVDTKKMALIK